MVDQFAEILRSKQHTAAVPAKHFSIHNKYFGDWELGICKMILYFFNMFFRIRTRWRA